MEPWYKVATPRKEVREGRSFNPDEFAVAPEQVATGISAGFFRLSKVVPRRCPNRATGSAGWVLGR
jgi:hypothetical protein